MRDYRSGSLRERRRGVWEVRISVATDPITGRALQRSFTFRGTRAQAEARCAELAADYATRREVVQAAPFITVGEVLEQWIEADHDWAPSTWVGYRSNARALRADRLASIRVRRLSPRVAREAIAAWREAGVTPSVLSGRFTALRAALGWAAEYALIEHNPLLAMRGPPQCEPREHAPIQEVRRLLQHVAEQVEKGRADLDSTFAAGRRLLRAEQMLLLIRLAADTGARRGELSALKVGDLTGRVLHIRRGASVEVVGPTKTRRRRRLTVGATTVGLWGDLVAGWAERSGRAISGTDWLFRTRLDQDQRLTTSALAHCFTAVRDEAGLPGITLHRFRHGVATFLVDRGEILKAQQRLGHRDASTTLRNYAHALPLEDQVVADAIDELLSDQRSGERR